MSVVEQTHHEYTAGHSEGNLQHNNRVALYHADVPFGEKLQLKTLRAKL